MATDKRARQRANRAEKRARETKRRRMHRSWELVKKWGAYAALIVAALVLLQLFTG